MSFNKKGSNISEINQLKESLMTDEKVKLTLLVDKKDRRKIKSIAAASGITVTEILCKYIKEYIRSYGDTVVHK